jgi:hypothetical protein
VELAQDGGEVSASIVRDGVEQIEPPERSRAGHRGLSPYRLKHGRGGRGLRTISIEGRRLDLPPSGRFSTQHHLPPASPTLLPKHAILPCPLDLATIPPAPSFPTCPCDCDDPCRRNHPLHPTFILIEGAPPPVIVSISPPPVLSLSPPRHRPSPVRVIATARPVATIFSISAAAPSKHATSSDRGTPVTTARETSAASIFASRTPCFGLYRKRVGAPGADDNSMCSESRSVSSRRELAAAPTSMPVAAWISPREASACRGRS